MFGLGHAVERGARALVGIDQHRRRMPVRLILVGDEIHAVDRDRFALRPVDRLLVVGMLLAERRAEEARERRVEPVEPDHRRGAEVAVVVPGPGRRHHEVAGLHRQLLAGDRRVGALALDDEAQRARRVAVRRRDLARHDDLQSGEQRIADEGGAAQGRIFQAQHAALGLLLGDEVAGAHELRPHLGVAPVRRHAGRAGLQSAGPLPQREQAHVLHLVHEPPVIGIRSAGDRHGVLPAADVAVRPNCPAAYALRVNAC